MNRKVIAVVTILITILFLILYWFGIFNPLIERLNKIFLQNLDLSCKQDSDCKLIIYPDQADCRPCRSCKFVFVNESSVIAVNSKWKPFCLIQKQGVMCAACIGGIGSDELSEDVFGRIVNYSSFVKCIDNQCQKVLE